MLYFDNLSRDSNDAYLADGLTEELIVRLQQVQRLTVKSRFESQRFRGRPVTSPAQLGRSLNAAYLVTGSVQKAGTRVRVRVELLRAATGATVWSDAPERSSSDILTVESEIAEQVARAVAGTLLPAERSTLAQRPTRNPRAYELYLRALHAADSWSQQDPMNALAYLDSAIALDSSFAAAYALKANAWTTLGDAFLDPRVAFGRARDAAREALARDSTLAMGWIMLGTAISSLDYDVPEALRLTDRGAALDPHQAWGPVMRSLSLFVLGRRAEAIAESRRGFELDTLDAVGAAWYVSLLYYGNLPDSMDAVLPRVRSALAPPDIQVYRAAARFRRGDYAGTLELLDWHYYGGYFGGMYVRSLVAVGRREEARAVLDSLLAARRGPNYQNALPIAQAAAALGDTTQALDWLERAYEERTQWLLMIDSDTLLAPLRSQPRYIAIRRRMRLSP